jgi:glucokinase
MGELIAGIDIGATKLHAVVARPDGEVLARARKKAKGHKGFDAVMERVVACLDKACRKANVSLGDLEAVGVGAPSPIRPDGTMVHAPNLGWTDAPLAATLGDMIGKPVVAENDCNLGTLGEWSFGAGRGIESLVGLFVGTGLGSGMVLGGEMIRGRNRLAAEAGHMIVQANGRECGCGHRGCLEAYASKRGIGNRLRIEIEENGRSSMLQREADVLLDNVRSGILLRAYEAGDNVVMEALHELCWYLGVGVANFVTLLGPDAVVLGGGVFEALGEHLIELVRDSAEAHTFPETAFANVKLDLAQLGDDSVALGAVAYALRSLKR